MRWCVVALFVLAGCSATPPPLSLSPPKPLPERPPTRSWCPSIPGLTDDASGDLTGQANDMARVLQIKSAHEWEILRCPGTTGLGITIVAFASKPIVPPEKPVSPLEKIYVIKASVKSEAYLPAANPLYLDGVRVYFEVSNIEPL